MNSAVIGAMRDFTNGYLGCLRSIWVNGFKLNLNQMKNQLKGTVYTQTPLFNRPLPIILFICNFYVYLTKDIEFCQF